MRNNVDFQRISVESALFTDSQFRRAQSWDSSSFLSKNSLAKQQCLRLLFFRLICLIINLFDSINLKISRLLRICGISTNRRFCLVFIQEASTSRLLANKNIWQTCRGSFAVGGNLINEHIISRFFEKRAVIRMWENRTKFPK